MSEGVKISIIMPVYNGGEYLPKCLDSLVNQTLKNIEIICIDDGSTDNSLEILHAYAEKDSRIKIINQENSGCYVARNAGLDAACGDYVMFVDADDWLELNACELAYNEILKYDSDLVCFDLYDVSEDGKKYVGSWFRGFNLRQTFYFNNCPKSFYYINTSVWAKLFKRKSLFLRFDNSLRKSGDTVYFWRYCLNNPKISVLNMPLYNYLQRENSIMFDASNIKELKNFKAFNALLQSDEYENASEMLKCRILDRLSKSVSWEIKNFKNDITSAYKKELKIFLKNFRNVNMNKVEDLRYYSELKRIIDEDKFSALYSIKNNIFSVEETMSHRNIKFLGIKFSIKKPEINYPIDMVYLWVDGSDEQWQQDKKYWQEQCGLLTDNATNNCRFVDNEELRYSLRSVARGLPWINHIYIVTNGQVPKWLDKNHPKITIVPHSEIMPSDALPTFNSEAIETCIANIPNLSEHFIYANDDCFVFAKLAPDYFFDKNGNPVVRFVRQRWKKSLIAQRPYLQSITYALNLIKKKYGKFYRVESTHNMDAYKKSYFLDCVNAFKEEFDRTAHCKFRSPNCVQRILINLFSVVKKGCRYKYTRVHSRKTAIEYVFTRLVSPEKLDELIRRHNPKLKLFCINDNENTLQEDREAFKLYLQKLYFRKQDWELD